MELVAVHEPTQPGAPITASVFLPQSAQAYYLRKVEAYRDVDTDRGRPRNEPLVSRMETVRLATARLLFTDHDDLFPQAADEQVWWEVWLRDGRRENFEHIAEALNITLRTHAVRFPERVVMLALASTAMLDRMIAHSDVVAELRRAKDTPSFFMGLGGAEQRDWSDELLGRVRPPQTDIAVCILDSGVRRTHPLIEPALAVEDWHTVKPAWGSDDTPAWSGHGTRMAGVGLYGDLVPLLVGGDPVHCPFGWRVFVSFRQKTRQTIQNSMARSPRKRSPAPRCRRRSAAARSQWL
nr:S8 family serine peptidase [Mesorhizobium sp.]